MYLWISLIIHNSVWKQNGSKGIRSITKQNKPIVRRKSLKWTFLVQHIYSFPISLSSLSLFQTGTIWLDKLAVTCMCIICRGHILCSSSRILLGEGDSRAQDDSTPWIQTLVLQAALQHSVIIILCVQTIWGQTVRYNEYRKSEEDKGDTEKTWRSTDGEDTWFIYTTVSPSLYSFRGQYVFVRKRWILKRWRIQDEGFLKKYSKWSHFF